jgi:hypothetical protein
VEDGERRRLPQAPSVINSSSSAPSVPATGPVTQAAVVDPAVTIPAATTAVTSTLPANATPVAAVVGSDSMEIDQTVLRLFTDVENHSANIEDIDWELLSLFSADGANGNAHAQTTNGSDWGLLPEIMMEDDYMTQSGQTSKPITSMNESVLPQGGEVPIPEGNPQPSPERPMLPPPRFSASPSPQPPTTSKATRVPKRKANNTGTTRAAKRRKAPPPPPTLASERAHRDRIIPVGFVPQVKGTRVRKEK